jgi:calcineurin-like phosphoesterase family protein
MTTWFTADQHFGHVRIQHFEAKNRGHFKGVRDMDDFMIERWNSVVKKDDVVYHLGDFALAPKRRKQEIVQQLNGYKISIRGNHDAGPFHMKEIGFQEVYPWMTLNLTREELPNKRILLVHEATKFLKRREGSVIDYIVCGHVHSNWKRKQNAVNVGVDVWEFLPISLPTALAVFNLDLTGVYDLTVDRVPKWKGATASQEIYSVCEKQ